MIPFVAATLPNSHGSVSSVHCSFVQEGLQTNSIWKSLALLDMLVPSESHQQATKALSHMSRSPYSTKTINAGDTA